MLSALIYLESPSTTAGHGGLSAPSVKSVGFKESLETEKTFLDYLPIGTMTQLSNFMGLAFVFVFYIRE